MTAETGPVAAAEAVVRDGLDEWLHRMHGIISSCDHGPEAQGIVAALAAAGLLADPGATDSAAARLVEIVALHSDTHQSVAYIDGQPEYTTRCSGCRNRTPCPTIRAARDTTEPEEQP